eukprot:gnl/TRDRNA2_/TRDRNA2_134337_c0_seq1.p1 gnl/TRDRNA2_/TRDRNA2_134337_c0~~gnl/TRDRNA2_/TRDRNA2_134337_c0_seq1.p1  ORF type:complete len:374 (+),score=79.20 gnl/TRDRNA2_/TRDRNA2_134337_c0_seq1:65-1186(+)
MPPKAKPKYLIRAKGVGQWARDDGTTGEFRVSVDTDLAEVIVNIGPDYEGDGNPVPLKSYSLKWLRGGSHLRFQVELLPLRWRGELELNVLGGFGGKFEDASGPGKVTGSALVEDERVHVFAMPVPTQALAEKLKKEPDAVKWEVPGCIRDGLVLFVGIGGASKTGKTTLTAALADCIRGKGREVATVDMGKFDRCPGTYSLGAGVHESMFENPSSVNWQDFVRAITTAADKVASKGTQQVPSIVIAEGFLIFWMRQIREAFHKRIYLRATREEVLRRRQASATLPEPFVEHVFWPCHLQFGQPQDVCDEIQILGGGEDFGYPVPDDVIAKAMSVILAHPAAPAQPIIEEAAAPEAPAAESESPADGDAAPDA